MYAYVLNLTLSYITDCIQLSSSSSCRAHLPVAGLSDVSSSALGFVFSFALADGGGLLKLLNLYLACFFLSNHKQRVL